MTPLEILRELVAIPSVSNLSNLPLLDWVTGFLEPRGWRCHRFPYTDDAGVAKSNLIACPVSFGRPSDPPDAVPDRIGLAFVCHTDTVPPAVGWHDPYTLHTQENSAYGLGSCDVKAALACFLAAIQDQHSFSQSPQPDSSLALILTADEEIGCKGMDRLLAVRPDLRMERALISEPTSLRPAIAGKGYALARVTLRGREAHSAFPREGVSAIAAAADIILRIHALQPATTHPLFDPPATTFNIGVITGGTAKNILPGECSFLLEWRAVPGELPGSVAATLRQLVHDAAQQMPGVSVHFDLQRDEPGFDRAPSTPLADQLTALLCRQPTGISFGSEATRVARIAGEIVVVGPGDMHTAHSDRECVPIAELDEWMQTLRALFRAGF